MPSNPYDKVRYPTWPRLETHPDRMAAVAILMGMHPAPVERCRVLEIGAGDGGNLIPMAYTLPASHFTGIDLARAPVAEGRAAIRALRLRNIELRRTDLREFDCAGPAFDYIIAHGLYSWVPAATRDALLAVCRHRLAPQGVAFVSYNVFPGRHLRQMLREMALLDSGGAPSPDGARRFLAFLGGAAMVSAPWRALLTHEIGSMIERDDAGLIHDDLAEENQPVYFHKFAAHAERHRLQYLGDVHVHEMVDHRGALAALGRDRLRREQYLDFLKLRRFRQSLLCRREVRLARDLSPRHLGRLVFSSPARRDGEYLEGAHGVRIRAGDPAVEDVAGALAASWPRPLPFAALRRLGPSAREILFTLCTGGFVEPHAATPPPAPAPGERPRASAVARYMAQTSRTVTNLCHRSVELPEAAAALLPLLDGTRRAADIGHPNLAETLEWLGRMALLE